MISNKTLATIFFITLNMQRAAASSSEGTQEPSSTGMSTLLARQGPARNSKEVLHDTTSTVEAVGVQGEDSGETGTLQEQPAPQVNKEFEELIKQEKYGEIIKIGEKMKPDEFWKQLGPVVKTPGQCKGVADSVTKNTCASLFLYGDVRIVRNAIRRMEADRILFYRLDLILKTVTLLAFKKNCHDRVIDLLVIQQEITANRIEDPEVQENESFNVFVNDFVQKLAPEKDGVALRRFLTFRGEELRTKYPDILDTLCRYLVFHLSGRLRFPGAEKLLADLIGQPFLLKPAVFTSGFLCGCRDAHCSDFIKYGYREAIQERLKEKRFGGCEYLWYMMQKEQPKQFPGVFPVTEEARAAACAHLPTKQQKEIQWIKENAPGFLETVEPALVGIFPNVIASIVFEYARPTWLDVPSTKP